MTPFADLLHQGTLAAWLFLPSAVLLGALHGLEPGHSKTMMAAFIVAIRGTFAQAALLAVMATLSHTAIVWAVALLALAYGKQWGADAAEPWFQIASGVLVIAVALWMAWRTWASRPRALPPPEPGWQRLDTGHGPVEVALHGAGAPDARFRVRFLDARGRPVPPPAGQRVRIETDRAYAGRQVFALADRVLHLESRDAVPLPHDIEAALVIAHGDHAHRFPVRFADPAYGAAAPRPDAPYPQAGDAHARAHADQIRRRFAGRPVTTGQIALFGLTGGLLPCPAAITVLVLCLQIQRFWLGVALVLGFSVGLALTLLASGLLAAWGMRHATRRWPGLDALLGRLPYLASAVVVLIGLYLGWTGLAGLA